MRRFSLWLADHIIGTYLALGLLVLGALGASAATSYDVSNNPQMFLDAGITASQTTNIRLSALKLNGLTVTNPNTSGGVLRIRQGSLREDIYFASGSVNATTRVTTLYGVIRDLCFNRFRIYVGCGNGKAFSKGASVELSVDARLLNLKANIDRANKFTASGALQFEGSGSLAIPTFLTTAERDKQMGATPGGPVRIACVSGEGRCYYYTGGQWVGFGSGGIVNASQTVAGKIQMANGFDIGNRNMTGSTLSQLVLSPFYLLKNSSGSTSQNKIPLLDAAGTIPANMGGLGLRNATQSGVLIGNGSSPVTLVLPGSSGNVLKSNGSEWVSASGTQTGKILLLTGSIASTPTILDSVNNRNYKFTQTGTVLSSQINGARKTIHVHANGSAQVGAGNIDIKLALNGTPQVTCTLTTPSSGVWTVDFWVTTRVAGASGELWISALGAGGGGKSCTGAGNPTGIDLTSNVKVNIIVDFPTSNGSNTDDMDQFIIFTAEQ